MAYPKASEHDVVNALITAFRRDGYAGAAIRDLTAATGLKSASLYHRFPTKADMAQAALRHAGKAFDELVIIPLTEAGPPVERLAASAAGLSRFYNDGRLGCLLAVFALSDAPEQVSLTVSAAFSRWRDVLAGVLNEAGAKSPSALADDHIAAVQGALLLARATGDRGAFARAVERLAATP